LAQRPLYATARRRRRQSGFRGRPFGLLQTQLHHQRHGVARGEIQSRRDLEPEPRHPVSACRPNLVQPMLKRLLLAASLWLSPPLVAQTVTNIAYLRTLVDGVTYAPTDTTNLYTAEGVVTTHTNLTTAGNALFYIQDNTAGISVVVGGG